MFNTKYNISALAKKTGFSERVIEKVCRMSDVLYEISVQEFLSKRLSLYGGSALNFIYFKNIPRLSVDLDFNYRQINDEDWENARNEIDKRLKLILKYLGYEEIAIQPTYPLLRMEISYKNMRNSRDKFKIEIGYMRRISILFEDISNKFLHIGREEYFPVLTPQKEELFGNKFCTMLYRGESRDMFDVYQIADLNMHTSIFKKCAVIDSLMHAKPKLHEINIKRVINSIIVDDKLRNLLRERELPQNTESKVLAFTTKIIQRLSAKEKDLIDTFYDRKIFTPELIGKEFLHPHIKEHPAIKWALQNL